jgi:SAM-dependent methyltransferase
LFGRFLPNDPAPPLPFEAESFDLVYALSVFTHLPTRMQRPWMEELLRVTVRGGHVVFSTHGLRYLSGLSAEQQSRFLAGELVVIDEDAAGSNRCGAYHPLAYVREILTAGSIVVNTIAEGALGNPHQDLHLLRKS